MGGRKRTSLPAAPAAEDSGSPASLHCAPALPRSGGWRLLADPPTSGA